MRKPIANLPQDKQRILDALLDRVEQEYPDDVSVVVVYGSFISGMPHAKSDLDFFFIPKTERGYQACLQFIIDGIGYDFWPISWQRAEGIANFAEPVVSLIADGVVAYYQDTEDHKRFDFLRKRVEDILTRPENRLILWERAAGALTEAKALFFDFCQAMPESDGLRAPILARLITAVAYLNSTYVKRAVYNIKEVARYAELSDRFLELWDSAVKETEPAVAKEVLQSLIEGVDRLLQEQKRIQQKPVTAGDLPGFYEEIKSSYNKLIHAAKTGNYLKAYFAAWAIQNETEDLLAERYADFLFPDLANHLQEGGYSELIDAALKHEKTLVEVLNAYGVEINEYESIDQFSQATRGSTTC